MRFKIPSLTYREPLCDVIMFGSIRRSPKSDETKKTHLQ